MPVPLLASAALVASWLAQAELAPPEEPATAPAPVAPPPASEEPPAQRPVNTVAVHGRLATRAAGPDSEVPREGFSVGGTFEHRWGGVAGRLTFGAGLDFFFDRFASGSTQNSFVALQTVSLERAAIHPWIGVGAGLGVANVTRPVARGAVGVELPFNRGSSIALRADLTHALSGDRTFGDLVDFGVGLLQHF
jgi:hypothetical protein